ncbi:biopolymer transport protein ExbD [Variovorax boronicumulans]|jgi:biopolymer transport protein ExbD|uniref:Biopolymer transport protein ExbD n=2 Tax=Variovorax TaxID=34072 RepID=A0AAW8CYX5_9BURK|nr:MULTISPECIES: biopolymer transporter ExbD [Variovorax]ADU36263.1 Biopolymer transport protein ExbD/TolR [Variovorax paradoxus EPS]MDP9895402.1 biopolymer transport protein ExbD [Variovorax boronicumulans]MDP9995410.1 biopolymer transport protein ExbD [Variovorax boronicumulans]MDQ0006700.1 biopolymer transport protein ExbD [Variovorax boronicumulans]MDQ0012427.1 biopolymer transport protein ExbD [Variovorax boronicumulans]
MAFGTQDEPDEVMNEINMTPLVDVMLVLLIIFIITVPVMKHAVNIDLPRASSEPEQPKPQNILFSVTADGSYYWNEQKIDDSELPNRLAAEAAKEPQPELHIRGDKAVRYERVAKAMSEAREAGVRKIGFITEPDAK